MLTAICPSGNGKKYSKTDSQGSKYIACTKHLEQKSLQFFQNTIYDSSQPSDLQMNVSTGMDAQVSKEITPDQKAMNLPGEWDGKSTAVPQPSWDILFRGGKPSHSISPICPRTNSRLVEMHQEYPAFHPRNTGCFIL